MPAINEFDIAFIVDTTSSMGSFINEARREMRDTLQKLAELKNVAMRVAIVEYRDHPPEDQSFVYRAHDFTSDLDETQKRIHELHPNGGGDWPEAVLDGVMAACTDLSWRDHSRRIAVLIGDAPPHGYCGRSSRWPDGCPCGETIESATSLVEESCIRLFSVPLYDEPYVRSSFKQLALLTGGGSFPVGGRGKAMDEIRKIVEEEFGNIPLDEKVLDGWNSSNGEISPNDLAENLNVSLDDVYASLGRLGSRNLLDAQAVSVT
jgi:hypothetical protein